VPTRGGAHVLEGRNASVTAFGCSDERRRLPAADSTRQVQPRCTSHTESTRSAPPRVRGERGVRGSGNAQKKPHAYHRAGTTLDHTGKRRMAGASSRRGLRTGRRARGRSGGRWRRLSGVDGGFRASWCSARRAPPTGRPRQHSLLGGARRAGRARVRACACEARKRACVQQDAQSSPSGWASAGGRARTGGGRGAPDSARRGVKAAGERWDGSGTSLYACWSVRERHRLVARGGRAAAEGRK
jgi:hypothetical protein